MPSKLYNLWRKIALFAQEKAKDEYLKPNGGCDSCCPVCKQWESLGNKITTKPLDDGSDERTCSNCGNVWLAIFTPAGFIPVDDCVKREMK